MLYFIKSVFRCNFARSRSASINPRRDQPWSVIKSAWPLSMLQVGFLLRRTLQTVGLYENLLNLANKNALPQHLIGDELRFIPSTVESNCVHLTKRITMGQLDRKRTLSVR